MMDEYVYSGTNILRNKFDIQNDEILSQVECGIVLSRTAMLRKCCKFKTFDINHIKQIHKFLFSDIYDWAGTFRDIDIAKGGTSFCEPDKIESRLEIICGIVRKNRFFKKMPFDNIVRNLAMVLNGLNNIHPFREGNGRTQRFFVEQIALKAGYELDFSEISVNDMRNACMAAARGDSRLMEYLVKSNFKKRFKII